MEQWRYSRVVAGRHDLWESALTGGKDEMVPPQSVRRLVEKLKRAGRKVLSIIV